MDLGLGGDRVGAGEQLRQVVADARAAGDLDTSGLTQEAPAPVAKKTAKPKAPSAPPDVGHKRCMDAYHDAFLACTQQKPIIGGAEGTAMKLLREKFAAMDAKRTPEQRDEAVIVFLRNFYANDWRGPTTSLRQLASDPTRYLVPQKRFSRSELGAGMQPADDNMVTRYYKDEDFR